MDAIFGTYGLRIRSAVEREIATKRQRESRALARPANSLTTWPSWPVIRVVRRWYRSSSPGTCLRKACRGQTRCRTRTDTTARRPFTGRSATVRSWKPCALVVGVPHFGHGTASCRVLAGRWIAPPWSVTLSTTSVDNPGNRGPRGRVDVAHAMPTIPVALRHHRLRDGPNVLQSRPRSAPCIRETGWLRDHDALEQRPGVEASGGGEVGVHCQRRPQRPGRQLLRTALVGIATPERKRHRADTTPAGATATTTVLGSPGISQGSGSSAWHSEALTQLLNDQLSWVREIAGQNRSEYRCPGTSVMSVVVSRLPGMLCFCMRRHEYLATAPGCLRSRSVTPQGTCCTYRTPALGRV